MGSRWLKLVVPKLKLVAPKQMLVATIDPPGSFTPPKIWPDSTSCCRQAPHAALILGQAIPANPRARALPFPFFVLS
jgi:hypothetical protein